MNKVFEDIEIKALENLKGSVFLYLKDFEDIQKFEAERFTEIRKDPKAIYDIQYNDVLMSPESLVLLYAVGGNEWLGNILEFCETLDEGSVPIRFNNIMNSYRIDGEIVLNEDLIELICGSLLWEAIDLVEDEVLKHALDLFTRNGNGSINTEGYQMLLSGLNSPEHIEIFEPYVIKFSEDKRCFILSADHLQEDIESSTFRQS